MSKVSPKEKGIFGSWGQHELERFGFSLEIVSHVACVGCMLCLQLGQVRTLRTLRQRTFPCAWLLQSLSLSCSTLAVLYLCKWVLSNSTRSMNERRFRKYESEKEGCRPWERREIIMTGITEAAKRDWANKPNESYDVNRASRKGVKEFTREDSLYCRSLSDRESADDCDLVFWWNMTLI